MNNKFQKKEIQNNEDVIIDILLRLPSKSLARSRCVSKYWNTLITSPSFIKAHLHRPSELGHHLIYQEDIEKKTKFSRLKMRLSGCSEFSKIDYHLIIAEGFKKFKLIESINGIVCLYAVNHQKATSSSTSSSSRILLWNPAINDCFVVPEPRFPILSAKYYCVGFGFNPLSNHYDDFKVVSITLYEDEGEGDDEKCSSSRAEIYSRRTNSWKEIVGWFPKWTSSNITGNQIIYEECICWSPYYMTKKAIVSFNVVSEEFHEMTLPDSIPSYDRFKGCITLLDGCVSLLAPTSRCYEVWTMKEFGNIESWIKLYNINLSPWVAARGRSTDSVCVMYRPLGFASTNEAVFWYRFYKSRSDSWGNEVVFCDTASMEDAAIWTRTAKTRISLDSSLVDCRFKLYVESLIPIS